LRNLSRRDQRGHGDEAAIAGREIGTQPQISEQAFGRILDEARRHEAELVAHVLRALRLGCFIQRQRRQLVGRKLALADASLPADLAPGRTLPCSLSTTCRTEKAPRSSQP
jgi:hypothetical protein